MYSSAANRTYYNAALSPAEQASINQPVQLSDYIPHGTYRRHVVAHIASANANVLNIGMIRHSFLSMEHLFLIGAPFTGYQDPSVLPSSPLRIENQTMFELFQDEDAEARAASGDNTHLFKARCTVVMELENPSFPTGAGSSLRVGMLRTQLKVEDVVIGGHSVEAWPGGRPYDDMKWGVSANNLVLPVFLQGRKPTGGSTTELSSEEPNIYITYVHTGNPFVQFDAALPMDFRSGAILKTTQTYAFSHPIYFTDVSTSGFIDGGQECRINWDGLPIVISPGTLRPHGNEYWREHYNVALIAVEPSEGHAAAVCVPTGETIAVVTHGAGWKDSEKTEFRPSGIVVKRFNFHDSESSAHSNEESNETRVETELGFFPGYQWPSLVVDEDTSEDKHHTNSEYRSLKMLCYHILTARWHFLESADDGETWQTLPPPPIEPFYQDLGNQHVFRGATLTAQGHGLFTVLAEKITVQPYENPFDGVNQYSNVVQTVWDGNSWSDVKVRISDVFNRPQLANFNAIFFDRSFYLPDRNRLTNAADYFLELPQMNIDGSDDTQFTGQAWTSHRLPFPHYNYGNLYPVGTPPYSHRSIFSLNHGGYGGMALTSHTLTTNTGFSAFPAPHKLLFRRTWQDFSFGGNLWEGNSFDPPVEIADVTSFDYVDFVLVEQNAADSSRLIITNGVDKHFVSDDLGETWELLE